MRGKVLQTILSGTEIGITPAYAGKSQWAGGLVVSIGDHPRICGEKPVGAEMGAIVPGSPPHMRGKGSIYGDTLKGTGITPAYAGKRLKRPMGDASAEDHPRICGEKYYTLRRDQLAEGSPPHMRGKEINGVL